VNTQTPKNQLRTIQRVLRWVPAALIVTLGALAGPVSAQESSADSYEVSYLVFHKDAGFDRPTFKADVLDGTVSIEFQQMPKNWQALLKAQINTERKRRFFEAMQPITSNGIVVGIRVQVSIGAFSMRTYVKRNPSRWVLRISTTTTPALNIGHAIMPIVPYADLIADDVPGHDGLAEAELMLANGNKNKACPMFEALQRERDPVRSWATIRSADCYILDGRYADAARVLELLVRVSELDVAVRLAILRLEEVSGRILTREFRPAMYHIDPTDTAVIGTIADEISYREARAWLLRGDAQRALVAIHGLLQRRPYSPFFLDRTFLQAVRWRALRTLSHQDRWLDVANAYIDIPPGVTDVPHWADIHMVGAEAMRRIGLPRRSQDIYQHLLRRGKHLIQEPHVILSLAESFLEQNDIYRARMTMNFLVKEFPKWKNRPAVLVARGRIALHRKQDPEAGALLRELSDAKDNDWSVNEMQFAIYTALRAMRLEGLAAAQDLVPAAGSDLSDDVRVDLAMVAGDCEQLKETASPVELADGETLLWAGACLVHRGRMDEASVLFEAIRLYAPQIMSDPTLEPLIRLTKQSADWWVNNQDRLPNTPKQEEPTL